MKKLITGALALTFMSSMAMADFNDMYFGGGIVQQKIDEYGSGKAVEAYIGKLINKNFGAEVRVSKTFSEAEESGTYIWPDRRAYLSTVKSDITTVAIYGTYTHNLTPELSIVPKVGLLHTSLKQTINSGGFSFDEDGTTSGLSYGIDLKYNINYDWKAYLSYAKVAKDVQHVSIGVEKRF